MVILVSLFPMLFESASDWRVHKHGGDGTNFLLSLSLSVCLEVISLNLIHMFFFGKCQIKPAESTHFWDFRGQSTYCTQRLFGVEVSLSNYFEEFFVSNFFFGIANRLLSAELTINVVSRINIAYVFRKFLCSAFSHSSWSE